MIVGNNGSENPISLEPGDKIFSSLTTGNKMDNCASLHWTFHTSLFVLQRNKVRFPYIEILLAAAKPA